MKLWSIGSNNIYFTSSIFLEEAPWYIFGLQILIQCICSFIPNIPLPKIKIIRENEETNLRVWYGSISSLFHIFICEPISNWCYDKIETKSIEFPYFLLKEKFPESFKDTEEYFNDEDSDRIKANFEHSKQIGEQFEVVYKKIKNIFKHRVE